MQAGDREAFDVMLAELFGAIDRPLTEAKREGFWKALAKMSLVEFARCRDFLLGELESGESPRTFGVADIWSAKRRMRATGPVFEHEKPRTWHGDGFDVVANQRLLKHIMDQANCGIHYCSEEDRTPVHRGIDWSASRETQELTSLLVGYKNAWAQDMREWSGRPTKSEQDKSWRQCMERAEAEAVEIRNRYQRRVAA